LAVRLIRCKEDVSARTVVFDGCINDGIVKLADARTFFGALEPAPHIQDRMKTFETQLGAAIALHVRHGNGGNIMGHAPYWTSFGESIDRCLRAVDHVRSTLGRRTAVFLCTDGAEVQSLLGSKLDGLLVRPKTFLPPGAGELHLATNAWKHRDDALTEMLLLAKCAAIIRYPPGSFFSFYAACLLSKNDPSVLTAYDLQEPWDRDDPLSPSIIFRDV
jgi:hypothetical protein